MRNQIFQNSKLNKLRLFVGILVASQISVAQTVSSYGIELGLSFSQLPVRRESIIMQAAVNDKIIVNPLVGPLIGISKNWILSKHFQITSGLEYQMGGKRSYTYDQSTQYFKKTESWDNLTIHKICMPVSLGYVFRIGKIKPSFYLGLRPDIWLSASTYNKYQNWGVYRETSTNLFTKIVDYKPPKRLVNQFDMGISTLVGQHIQINVNYNFGYNYYITTYWYRGNYSRVPYPQKTSLANSDYVISMQYNFIRSGSKTKTE